MIPICRRNFLSRCGLAAAGGLLLAPLAAPFTSSAAVEGARQPLSHADRVLLRTLSGYSGDAYLWGGQAFARATGLAKEGKTTHLLLLVKDYNGLMAFLTSPAMKRFGTVRAAGNTLSFTFRGTSYTVTNNGPDDFYRIISGLGSPTKELRDAAAVSPFAHENVLYHPATGTYIDPYLALKKHSVELAKAPTGGAKAQFRTLVSGWLEAGQYDLPLGKSFEKFQSALLASMPTEQAAKHIAEAWMENIVALSAAYDVASLRPLLLSPLVSSSLESVFGLDAAAAADAVEKLRADPSAREYSDASIWLAVLMAPEIKDGTVGEWITGEDATTTAASQAALTGALRLIGESGPDPK